jgi:hypothetical protein
MAGGVAQGVGLEFKPQYYKNCPKCRSLNIQFSTFNEMTAAAANLEDLKNEWNKTQRQLFS